MIRAACWWRAVVLCLVFLQLWLVVPRLSQKQDCNQSSQDMDSDCAGVHEFVQIDVIQRTRGRDRFFFVWTGDISANTKQGHGQLCSGQT